MLFNTALFAWVSKDFINPEIVTGSTEQTKYEAPHESSPSTTTKSIDTKTDNYSVTHEEYVVDTL